ncbi:MAG: hypothetical protein HY841_05200 [Bacteroidetes bacterium]|nr:hypothetical protein [Bacteroidota bacterium]
MAIGTVGIAATALFFSSCGGGKDDEHSELKDVEVTTDTISSEVRVNFDLLRVNIPSPGNLTKKLTAAKINYNKSFLLPSSKGGSFSSNYQKAIGMGAFGSDLGMAASYNQPQDALEYLGQMGKLAGDLGISAAFDPEFSKQLISKIGQPDTFQVMLDKAFDKAERNLRSNQRVATTVLMVAGGWVESLFISVEGLNTNPSSPTTKGIYADISTHCHSFEYIFQLLDAYKSNADCAKLIQDMEPFKAQLIAIGKNPKIGVESLPKIRETVTALRNKITG